MNTKWITGLFALIASAVAVHAASLNVGDPAPTLQVSKWIQGEPVSGFETGKVYIVEFWATWCGPCRASIPHVNEIQNKFKDKGLVVIGQNVWEKDTSKVPDFVKKMGDKMTYRVALDKTEGDPNDGKMATTWMKASGSDGIPTAFLVDKQGKIAWIGHPMTLDDKIIDQVMAGTYDIKKAALDRENEQKSQQEVEALSKQLNENMKSKEWDKADATLTQIEKLLPDAEKEGVAIMRVKIMLDKGDFATASKLAEANSQAHKDDLRAQITLAGLLTSQETNKQTDLVLAQKLATRANEIAEGKNPGVLDLLARITFLQGSKDKAIELQTAAVEKAEGEMKTQLQANLDSYKSGVLPKAE